MKKEEKELSVYVHVPFCERKCFYCSFCSVEDLSLQEKYFEALVNEIKECNFSDFNFIVKSVYFGGGTPSCVKAEFIEKVLKAIKEKFVICDDCEITIECNPNSVNLEKLKFYKDLGINRVSFGVQSFNDEELAAIGRLHSGRQAVESVNYAKTAGFDNVSVDLLSEIPKQSKESIKKNLDIIKELSVNHVSLYSLILEEGTKIYSEFLKNRNSFPSEEEGIELFKFYLEGLKEIGFKRYEVSNFSKNLKSVCRHNMVYWNRGDYIGFGAAAHSMIDNVRFSNTEDVKQYISNKNFKTVSGKLTKKEIAEEIIMLGLRKTEGFSLSELKEQTGYDLLENKKDEIEKLLSEKLIKIKSKKISATENGMNFLNQIIKKLI